MGAASAGKPAIVLATGPMMSSRYRGERLGACTDCRRFWARYRAGEITDTEIQRVEANLATTAGTCAVMGTASSMAILIEILGLMLPGTAAIPAVHADRLRAAEETGKQAMELALSGRTMDHIVTQRSIDNALRALLAVGGSTNAVVHLAAIAGRLGLRSTLGDLNRLSDSTPVLVDLKPTGSGYMEDFYFAGGVAGLIRQLGPLMDLKATTITGECLEAYLPTEADWIDSDVIRSISSPVRTDGGLVALYGSLAPNGAVLKRAAADERFFERTARAIVFDGIDDLAARIDDPDLDITPDDALVLRNAGPRACGMPEAGYLPIPKKLARRGIKDMLRLSDARMSGTAFGTIVLHISPEAASGGPLGLIRTGDRLQISVSQRRLELLVDKEELASRRPQHGTGMPETMRGWRHLYTEHVLQAEEGCDLDFLLPRRAVKNQ
jgi:dihydroxy-acid dehydratase